MQALFRFERAIVGFALLSGITGVFAYATMARKEDPTMPDRYGFVTVRFAGATPSTVERLVAKPLEERLATVSNVQNISTNVTGGHALLSIELNEQTSGAALFETWTTIDQAIESAAMDLPDGAERPRLKHDLSFTESTVFAVTGSENLIELEQAAQRLKAELQQVDGVREIIIAPSFDEFLSIEPKEVSLKQLKLTRRDLAQQLMARAPGLAGGSVRVDSLNADVDPGAEYKTIEALAQSPIIVAPNTTVPLETIARLRPEVTLLEGRSRFAGVPAVFVSVVGENQTNAVALGDRILARVDSVRHRVKPLQINTFAFQPDHVKERLGGLMASLLTSVVLVGAVLFLLMGFRMGAVVALIVPMVATSSLAIFAIGGGVLEQISIAAFVVALGMLVDNAIVVVDEVQRGVNLGMAPRVAALKSVQLLSIPLLAATGTTLAAFLPLLFARSATADFIRNLPVVVMIALAMSVLFAILFTPLLAARVLQPRVGSEHAFSTLANWVCHYAVGRPRLVLMVALALVCLSIAAAPLLGSKFFPHAGRPEILVTLQLPSSTDIDTVDSEAARLEQWLLGRSDVASVATFIARSAPKIYYNMTTPRATPGSAMLVVRAKDAESVAPLSETIRRRSADLVARSTVSVSRFSQGPPTRAPVSVRIYAGNEKDFEGATGQVRGHLQQIAGVLDVRDNLGTGRPRVELAINDAVSAQRGATRLDVATALLAHTHGHKVGELRGGENPVPLILRSAKRDAIAVEDLASLEVRDGPAPIKLGELADVNLHWDRERIERRNGKRVTIVDTELDETVAPSEVLDEFEKAIAADPLPPGVTLEFGGAREGLSKANQALLTALPIGLITLVVILLAQFNSVRKVLIILVTVPLAATGVVPGLLLGGQAFGIMSLLGVIALAGIVVNNAIVLLDVVDDRLAEGDDLQTALRVSVARRLRPILLTTATTVVGLVPLAFSSAPLWPPMAWAMISGLLTSTMLTLFVVPALVRLFFRRASQEAGR